MADTKITMTERRGKNFLATGNPEATKADVINLHALLSPL